uniref:Uncharacterized protein n=1 Tax=Opuntia streptacantha TaxID=393608 RepID=A0A7C8ZLG4_OPUST
MQASATTSLLASPTSLSPCPMTTACRSPAVALRRVFRSYEVYGPSVNLPGLIMVNGIPDSRRKSSPIFLYFRTPKRFMMLHGSSLDLVTPMEETRTNLLSVRGDRDTRFLSPSQSTLSGVLSPSHLREGKAVVPVQHITCVTPSSIDGSRSSRFLVSPFHTCNFSSSCSPNNLVAFSGSRNKRRTLIFRLSNDATTNCPTPPVPPTTRTTFEDEAEGELESRVVSESED